MFNNKEEKNSFALYLLFNEKLIMNEKNISERIKRINNEQDNKYIITQRGNDELLNALKEIKDTKLIINKEEKFYEGYY